MTKQKIYSKNNFMSTVSPAVVVMLEREAKPITINRVLLLFTIIAVLIYSAIQSELNFPLLLERGESVKQYISGYFPPDFSYAQEYLQDTLITVSMALWGTLLAAVAAIPLSVFASNNISPLWVVQPTRRLLDAMRAINELVFALIFVVAVGLGPFAGVLAIFVYTTGILGKLFSEAVESIEPEPVEGIRATGANKIQEIIYGVIPQVMPLWISFFLYRLESNVRGASILGIVGAGGIGVSLYQSFGAFEYQKVSAILLILTLTTTLIDFISSKLRAWLV
jgi:phosphonate transport system permease protein